MSLRAVVFPLPFGPRRMKALPVGIERDVVEREGLPRAFAAHPVEKSGSVPEDLGDGFETDAQGGSRKPLYYRGRLAAGRGLLQLCRS